MACLTTKGWVVKEGVILTGALAEIFEHIIFWLNDEAKNKIEVSQKNASAIVRIWIESGDVFCEAYIYPPDNIEKEIILLNKILPFSEYIGELNSFNRENKEISAKLINI